LGEAEMVPSRGALPLVALDILDTGSKLDIMHGALLREREYLLLRAVPTR
jgi:hypothetical protein